MVGTYVPVDGSFRGAWCWYKVANKLKSEGHNVTTACLLLLSINPKHMQEVHSISEYHEPLMTFLDSLSIEKKGDSCWSRSWWDISICCHGKIPWKHLCCSLHHCNCCLWNRTTSDFLQDVLFSLGMHLQPIIWVFHFMVVSSKSCWNDLK